MMIDAKFKSALMLSAVLLISCSTQLVADMCADETSHTWDSAPENIGGGLVSKSGGAIFYTDNTGTSLSWSAFSCASNEQIVVNYYSSDSYNNGKLVANEVDLKSNLDNFENSISDQTDVLSLEVVHETAESHGLPVRKIVPRKENGRLLETCGCRVFYPELRGDKVPYEVEI